MPNATETPATRNLATKFGRCANAVANSLVEIVVIESAIYQSYASAITAA